jgi:hypothetical protein
MGSVTPIRRGFGKRPGRKIDLLDQLLGVVDVSGLARGVFGFGGLFDFHVVKLFGIKDFATFQALDELRVFVPGNNSYPGVFASGGHRSRLVDELLYLPDCIGPFNNLKQAFL